MFNKTDFKLHNDFIFSIYKPYESFMNRYDKIDNALTIIDKWLGSDGNTDKTEDNTFVKMSRLDDYYVCTFPPYFTNNN